MRTALYARVSTTKLNGNGSAEFRQNPETQLQQLRDYCQHRGWEITGEYVDRGVSGAKEHRPELNRLTADAQQRKFDCVLVWKLDRFGRSLRHLVNALAEFEALGITFISLTDNLDLTTPSGRLLFQVIAAMAEFERELIRERVQAGMSRARAEGKRFGTAPYYLDVERIRERIAKGETRTAIAKSLRVSPALLTKRLK